MKLLLVDLDNLLMDTCDAARSAVASRAPRILLQRREQILNAVSAQDFESQQARWRSEAGEPECVVVIVANQVTMASARWQHPLWTKILRCEATHLARQTWHSVTPTRVAVELATVFTVPEAADEALLQLLAHSPWPVDDLCDEVALVTRDGNLQSEVENCLPRGWTRSKRSANQVLWSGAGIHRRIGSGAPPASAKRAHARAAWSQVLEPAGAPAGHIDLAPNALEAADRLQIALGRRAHLKSQISVTNRSVCGVRRLVEAIESMELGTMGHQIPLNWKGTKDYLEIRTGAVRQPITCKDSGPVSASPLGAGAIRLEGLSASAYSRLPAQLWRYFAAANPIAVAVSPERDALTANDFGLRGWSGTVALPAPVELAFKIGSRPASTGNSELVCYPESGWWWADLRSRFVNYHPQCRTGIPATYDNGAINQFIAAVPCLAESQLYFCAPIHAGNRYATASRKLGAGTFGIASVLGLRSKQSNVWILAGTNIAAGQEIELCAVQEWSEPALIRKFPGLSADIANRLRRLPLALASLAHKSVSDSPVGSVQSVERNET